MRKPSQDRRKINVPIGDEKRGTGKDSRKCPECRSSLQNSVQAYAGGTWTTTYCIRCDYRSKSKQIDEGRMVEILGFENKIVGTAKKPLLELDAKFLKISGTKPGDTLEVKPLFTPESKQPISWILKKAQ